MMESEVNSDTEEALDILLEIVVKKHLELSNLCDAFELKEKEYNKLKDLSDEKDAEISALQKRSEELEWECEIMRKNLEEVKATLDKEVKRRKDAEDELQLLKEKKNPGNETEVDSEYEAELQRIKSCFGELMKKLEAQKPGPSKSSKRKSSRKCSSSSSNLLKKKKVDTSASTGKSVDEKYSENSFENKPVLELKVDLKECSEIPENHPKSEISALLMCNEKSENMQKEKEADTCDEKAIIKSVATESSKSLNVENNEDRHTEQEISCSDISEKLSKVPAKDIQDSATSNEQPVKNDINETSDNKISVECDKILCTTMQSSELSLANCDADVSKQVKQNSNSPSYSSSSSIQLFSHGSALSLNNVKFPCSLNLAVNHKEHRLCLKKLEKLPDVVPQNSEKDITSSSTLHATDNSSSSTLHAIDNSSSKSDISKGSQLSLMKEALMMLSATKVSSRMKKKAQGYMHKAFRDLVNSNNEDLAKQYFHELFLFLVANGTESTLKKFLKVDEFKHLLILQERTVINAMAIMLEKNYDAFQPLCSTFFDEMQRKVVETEYENSELLGVYRVCAALCHLVSNSEFISKLCLIALSKDSVTGVFSVACMASIYPEALDEDKNPDGFVKVIMHLIDEKPEGLQEDLWKQSTNVFLKICDLPSASIDPKTLFYFVLNCCLESYLKVFPNNGKVPEISGDKMPHLWAVTALIKKNGYHWAYHDIQQLMIEASKELHICEADNQKAIPFYFMLLVHMAETCRCEGSVRSDLLFFLFIIIGKIKDKVPDVIVQSCKAVLSKIENFT